MSDWLLFTLLIFTCYRLSEFLVYDRGPFGMFQAVRQAAGIAASRSQKGLFFELAEVLNCTHCTGVWIAFPLAFILRPESVLMLLVYWFGLSGVQSFLCSFMEIQNAAKITD